MSDGHSRSIDVEKMPDSIVQNNTKVKLWLFRQLSSEALKRLHDNQGTFIPRSAIGKLSDINIIRSVLQQEEVFSGEEPECTATYIQKYAPKLFLIAVHVRLDLRELKNCFLHGVSDDHLTVEDVSEESRWIKDDYNRAVWISELQRHRWEYFAAFFTRDEAQFHQEFEPRKIIPYTYMKECGKGAFSIVFEVELEKSHQMLYRLKHNDNPRLALKRLDRRKTQDTAFQHEQNLLKSLLGNKHLHIIQLLATYRQNEIWYFLFPLANCNLAEYMSAREPEHSEKYITWKLNQILGLATGIQAIHDRQPDRMGASSSQPFLGLNNQNAQSIQTGYHHDIKPQNILHFKELEVEITTPYPELGVYQISDFGVGKFQTGNLGDSSKGTRHPRGTVTYWAPESRITAGRLGHSRLKDVYHISRPYDMWAFGCVIMEMLVWLIKGRDGLKEFKNGRNGPAEQDSKAEESDAYWIATPNFQGAQLRPTVWGTLNALREEEITRRSRCLKLMIKLVADILRVKPKERLVISEVVTRLEEIVEIAKHEDGFNGTIPSKIQTPESSPPILNIIGASDDSAKM
ncbi:kinase-like protein [Corynespora cassiicola Philippines]|uniref:Kinase-like protein n=1 Tax=Corynespora cassiicola Philippines TaxID=1448308 RepID=A0A2T2NQQ8_CORCC|nr:kinase-like protein [Corynespora cassiicola Philippines]